MKRRSSSSRLASLPILLHVLSTVGSHQSLAASGHYVSRRSMSVFRRSHIVMMPEGPECKSLAETIDMQLGNSRYVLNDVKFESGRYKDGAPPKGIDSLRDLLDTPTQPQTLKKINSKGKFIWFELTNATIWSTLGLTGGWSLNPKKNHIRLSLEFEDPQIAARRTLFFYDMRNFGTFRVSVDRQELEDKLTELGRDWLDAASRPTMREFQELGMKAAKYKRPLAVFLMDQKKTSGIGNYVLSEVLYKTSIHPDANCSGVSEEGWADLYKAIRETLEESYLSQTPLVSTSAYKGFAFKVYAQRTTPNGTPVIKVVGPHKRSIHHCPITQTRFAPTLVV